MYNADAVNEWLHKKVNWLTHTITGIEVENNVHEISGDNEKDVLVMDAPSSTAESSMAKLWTRREVYA